MACAAYFDDTGTHAASTYIMWGGFVGAQVQWDHSEPAWRAVLAERGLSHFHMTECVEGYGPYGNRAARDSIIHDLRQVILDAGLFGIAIGIDLAPWRELVTADVAPFLPSPNQICMDGCVRQAVEYAEVKDVPPRALTAFFGSGDTYDFSSCARQVVQGGWGPLRQFAVSRTCPYFCPYFR